MIFHQIIICNNYRFRSTADCK